MNHSALITIAAVAFSGLGVPVDTNRDADFDPSRIGVMRGIAEGVSVARDTDGSNPVIQLHILTEHQYGADVQRFAHPNWPKYGRNKLRTSWDATPLVEQRDEPWCERLNLIFPPGIRMGDQWLIVTHWRQDSWIGREIIEIAPFDPETEQRLMTRYSTAIRAAEIRSAGMTTNVTHSHFHSIHRKLRQMQHMIKEAIALDDDDFRENRVQRFAELKRAVTQLFEETESRVVAWVTHLRERKKVIDDHDETELQHVQEMIDIATARLDELRALLEEILAMEPFEQEATETPND